MKTTLNLPDDLMREVKLRAVQENRTLQDTIADLLRRGLSRSEASRRVRNRVQLPLIRGGRRAAPGQEPTPEQLAELLLEQETGDARGLLRQ